MYVKKFEKLNCKMFQDRISDLQQYVDALKSENSQLLAADGTNRSMDSAGSSNRRVGKNNSLFYLFYKTVLSVSDTQG